MNLEGIRALLVEDNPGDARLFLELVRETGAGYLKLEHVDRLDKALSRLSSEHFDVVLLDLSLPDEQGLTTLLRAHAHAPKVPIVILTGLDDEAVAVRAVRAGAQDYLVKGRVDGDLLVRSMRYATERWRAVEALERREEHYRSLIEHSLDLISILNVDGTIRYVSPSHERVLGYGSDELVGQNAFNFIHPDDLAGVKENFTRSEGAASLEFRFRHKDASWRMLESFGRNLSHVPGVSGLVVNSRDVTDRKRLEEQLHHSQRLEAVGRLAGGVAHDFNNLLMIITGYSQMLLDGMRPGDPARADLEQVVKAAERATDLTRQLLAFSRRQVVRPAILNLNQLVHDMDRMLRRVLGEDIKLIASFSPGLKTVRADPGQLEQVILNIVVNARDAMPRGGKLTLETSNIEVTEEFARTHPAPKVGHYAMLSLQDTGVGMDAGVLSRLFEPFFTTKEKGTGLGLSTSYGIIKQSGGDIGVESKPGQGATFHIYLPVTDEPAEPMDPPPGSPVPRGAETILLVEDEDGVRGVVESMLTRHGYNVLSTASSEEAMAFAEGYAGRIHLLITDIRMPGMGGRTMAESLIAQRPETKVLYVSGYGGPLASDTTSGFLQKPFTTDELTRKIRDLFKKSP
jgi:two-component system, cell cycle sensor histidine kinase and response regulator CckA